MKSELFRFFLFFFFLTLISSAIADYVTKDKQYLYADGGISIQEEVTKNWLQKYILFLDRLIFGYGGKTDSGENVYSHILIRLGPTFHLASFAIIFGTILSYLLSLYSIFLRSDFFKSLLYSFSNLILSTPVFVFAVLLLVVFFYKLQWFPPGGYESWNFLYIILPGVTLGIRTFARLTLYLLQEIWKEADSEYVTLLQTRNYSWLHIVFKEIFLKVFPLSLVIIILDFGSLLSGAMVVEEIFFFPGIGKSLYYSIKAMDMNLLSILLVFSGVIFYTLNRFALKFQLKLSGET